jgi:hypothetical protein
VSLVFTEGARTGRRTAALAAASILLCACGHPPEVQIDTARRAMSRAAEANGAVRAPAVCAAAQAALARAEAEIRLQMKRRAWSRDFAEAGFLATRAVEAAHVCVSHARAARDLVRDRAERALSDLEKGIARASGLARHVPDGEGIKNDILKAVLSLGEARTSFERGQYERAEEAAERGSEQIRSSVTEISRFIDEFRRSPHVSLWKRWVQETIRISERQNRTVILVDKLRRQLLVRRGRDDLASFTVDLGAGGIATKTRAGDEFTPEGRYEVTEVRGPGQTRYHRALMLNYPNADDRQRFRAAKRAGHVPRDGHIGSNIEIHGEGGRAQDWTQGCVALSNGDMDELTILVGVGTPVTIVGTIPDGVLE